MTLSMLADGEKPTSEMDNREPIAAILTAGMLPTLPIPRSRSEGGVGPVTEAEGVRAYPRETQELVSNTSRASNQSRSTPEIRWHSASSFS